MEHYWQTVIGRQFAAAIQTLRMAVEACPEELWDDRSKGSPFWHLAYHALIYTDFYLGDDVDSFQPRAYHVEQSQLLPGDYGEFAGVVETPAACLYSREQLVEYADECLKKCEAVFAGLSGARALERCGFPWYELNVGEFLLNNLRHAQHHAGQLTILLRREAGIGIKWMGTKDNKPGEPTW